MRLTIEHHTRYQYREEVRRSTQYLRLTPKSSQRQRIISWELSLPEHATCTTDGFGNVLHVLTLEQPHEDIHILARGEVEILEENAPETESLSPLIFLRHSPLTQPDAAIRQFAARCLDPQGHPNLEALMQAVLEKMPYTPGATQVGDSAAESFARGCGVCQDHSHVFVACCRSLGLPARYVSGYLYTADSSHVAMHAWCEVWYQDSWHTFDVTNQCLSPTQHLKLAVGIDYLDACPVRGVRIGGGTEAMQAHAAVQLQQQQQQ
ncbi:transglutaminase domain-containing protein [Pseudaeromonas sharmana]|uniref:Transglutaminase domain-containing protein n=1 Tax=Pseudaeromonas sharmana TaxID=328412 RepID=A0ABV8CJM6_9GAMM